MSEFNQKGPLGQGSMSGRKMGKVPISVQK